MQDFDGKGAKGRRSKEEIQKRNKEVSHHSHSPRHHGSTSALCTSPASALCTVDLLHCVPIPYATSESDVMQAQQRFRDRQKVRLDIPDNATYHAIQACFYSLHGESDFVLWSVLWHMMQCSAA